MRWPFLAIFLSFLVFKPFYAFAETSIRVGVTIPPQKYMVEQIGGHLVDVVSLVPSGIDPHTYEPKPGDLAKIGLSSVFFAVGTLEFEGVWLPRIKQMFPQIRMVRTAEAIGLLGTERHNGGVDPHVWLDPFFMMSMSRVVYHELRDLITTKNEGDNSAITDELDRRYGEWLRIIAELDVDISRRLATFRGQPFLVYHPAWGYFARAYGIKQVGIEEEGKEPSPSTLKRVGDVVRSNKIDVIFVHGNPPPAAAERLSRMWNTRLEVLDPIAYDWRDNLLRTARSIADALSGDKDGK